MKRIRLLNSTAAATVDDEDHEALLAGPPWRLASHGGLFYACRYSKSGVEPMTYAIMGPPPPGMVWDHKNGNGLDNRRGNLRAATKTQNAWNSRKRAGCSSRFKGVVRRKGRWIATVRAGGRPLYFGSFVHEEDAARAYDDNIRRLRGEFACVNFPRPGERCAVRAY